MTLRTVLTSCLAAGLMLSAAGPAAAAVHDSLPELLGEWLEMQEDPAPEWEFAWVRYEAAQSAWLDPTLYAGRTPAAKSALIDQALTDMGQGFGEQMQQLAEFERSWGGDMATVTEGLRREFRKVPDVELYVVYSMSPAKLAYGVMNGRNSMCLNARRMLPYNTMSTRVLLARHLFSWIVTRPKNPAIALPTVATRVQDEGLTLWAASRILPGMSTEEILEVTGPLAVAYATGRTKYAKELMAALESSNPEVEKRFFGPNPPDGWPPDTGRYLGLLIARELANVAGPGRIPIWTQAEYTSKARAILRRLAGG